MSPAMVKMWISISSMGFMFVSIILIYLSRYKLKNRIIKFISAFIAYSLLIISGIIIFLVVMGGPTAD
ncbi:DUF2768 domain-containing protein [Robertmurraya andreesenii]|uniref:Glucan phosphoethanolaminetransferase (Alkaline phosphatase superfamily) n=1 Tax=Anoxybacillus andreesenii TaxID=1325932 RepID=A0ABT9V2Q9_9BACL|nr:DUF2768 domain-containing protein [Robertmurraya andreesenii]MDQ0155230.1 glucan phosphoethanolaminetransferase (alkaline phosphatase superfamily) [Robertmurraya andreesenii]